jgi:hypothetical protein
VGAADDDHIIRINPGKLSTLEFSPQSVDKAAAIASAEVATLEYVDAIPLGRRQPADYARADAHAKADSDVRVTSVKASWIFRSIVRRGIAGPLVIALTVLASLSVLLGALFSYLLVYGRFHLGESLLERVRDLAIAAALLILYFSVYHVLL